MKRNQFIKTLGMSAGAFYASHLLSCSKSDSPNETAASDTPNTSRLGFKLKDNFVTDDYLDKLSYLAGEAMIIYINGTEAAFAALGLYDVKGTLKDHIITTIIKQTPGPEPFKNGFQYASTFHYTVPEVLKSGLYYWAGKIPFIIRNPSKNGRITVVLPSNTDNAYNDAGGLSSYTNPLSPILSFQRPYKLQYWSAEYWAWATTTVYEMDYIIDQDLDDYSNFSNSKILMLPGHSEYWTRKARLNFDRFINEGHDAIILSGNTMWWQVRYSEDRT